MRTLGNIIWFLLFGLVSGIILFLVGLVCVVSLILMPFGIKLIKLSGLAFWPFGKVVDRDFEMHPRANGLWLALFGMSTCVVCSILGIVLCVTIIGIPFGRQYFKLASYALGPFGAYVDKV